MGNICRSPTAEGFFRHVLAESDIEGQVRADSAGTHGYHIGRGPDHRAIDAAARFGVDMSGMKARRVETGDFGRFDLILAMDHSNLSHLEWMQEQAGGDATELRLMMEFSSRFPKVREVPDPYYGGSRDFDTMCELLDEATRGLLEAARGRVQGGSASGHGR